VSGDADEIGELDKAIEDLERRLEQLRSERERLAAKVTASTE
jgi:prefoldin subunit 5